MTGICICWSHPQGRAERPLSLFTPVQSHPYCGGVFPPQLTQLKHPDTHRPFRMPTQSEGFLTEPRLLHPAHRCVTDLQLNSFTWHSPRPRPLNCKGGFLLPPPGWVWVPPCPHLLSPLLLLLSSIPSIGCFLLYHRHLFLRALFNCCSHLVSCARTLLKCEV